MIDEINNIAIPVAWALWFCAVLVYAGSVVMFRRL